MIVSVHRGAKLGFGPPVWIAAGQDTATLAIEGVPPHRYELKAFHVAPHGVTCAMRPLDLTGHHGRQQITILAAGGVGIRQVEPLQKPAMSPVF